LGHMVPPEQNSGEWLDQKVLKKKTKTNFGPRRRITWVVNEKGKCMIDRREIKKTEKESTRGHQSGRYNDDHRPKPRLQT